MKPQSRVLFFATTSALMLCTGIEHAVYAAPPGSYNAKRA